MIHVSISAGWVGGREGIIGEDDSRTSSSPSHAPGSDAIRMHGCIVLYPHRGPGDQGSNGMTQERDGAKRTRTRGRQCNDGADSPCRRQVCKPSKKKNPPNPLLKILPNLAWEAVTSLAHLGISRSRGYICMLQPPPQAEHTTHTLRLPWIFRFAATP